MTTQHNKTYKIMNKEIIDEISITKDLAPNTVTSYTNALNQYSTYHELPMQDLLDEADNEEENRIRMKRRKIKQRILSFRQHLVEQKKAPLSINTMISKITSTYHFYEIETPLIPHLKKDTHELIEDIPTKGHIQTALETTNNIGLQALILFMSSSGTSRQEALSITINDFIHATSEYHNEVTIENVIESLMHQEGVVPTFQLYRKKTRYPYITFCSPEAVHKICIYLRQRLRYMIAFDDNEMLFHFSSRAVNKNFERLNDKIGWGWKGTRRFFHPHALRKFFATELLKSDMDSITIDFLSGRKINSTHEAYYKADPRRLKQKYMNFMENLMIVDRVNVRDVTTSELEELEHYRQREQERDRKIKQLERMLLDYMNNSP